MKKYEFASECRIPSEEAGKDEGDNHRGLTALSKDGQRPDCIRNYPFPADFLIGDCRLGADIVVAACLAWVRRGGPPSSPIILFDYDPSRAGVVPWRLLADFKGFLQSDGYEGYGATAARETIVHVGCLAHARRKFDESVKAQARNKTGRDGLAKQGLALINRIYAVEREARERDLDAKARKQLRDEKPKPIWDELRKWLDSAIGQAPPKTLVGKALLYLDKQWPRLIRCLDDGRIEVDNNLCENAIRPFVGHESLCTPFLSI